MAYETSNAPYLANQAIGGKGKLWIYEDEDSAATVRVSGYFTNGYALGMRAGDRLILQNAAGAASHFIVNAASTTAVDLTDATTQNVSTDSD